MTKNTLPYLTALEMAEVDRLMIEDYGIQLIQMMENAGRQLARLAVRRFLGGDPAGKHVAVLAGSGGNGGGALVCARNLLNWGAQVGIYLTKDPQDHSGVTLQQVQVLESYRVPLLAGVDLRGTELEAGLIIDGLIGYSLEGPPRGPAAEMIRWANNASSPILALDLPSGLDATTGEIREPCIRAAATLTLALPKSGLKHAGRTIVGELYLGDIGVPPELYARPPLNKNVGPIFRSGQIIQLGQD